MSDLSDLASLQSITQAQYQQQMQSFRRILEEEARLRGAIAKLDAQMRAARTLDTGTAGMRAIGADVMWQGWVDRTKAELNMQLARTLAIKEHHRAQVARAFGKVQVTEELLRKERAAQRQQQRKSALNGAIDMSVFGPGQ